MVTLLIFIIVFGLIIFIHELGHFLAAKRAGVRVEEFAFGFPPRIVSWKRGETVYALNLIPLGGYVKMTGEDELSTDPRSFSQKPLGIRAVVVVAGVMMNIFLAWVILTFLLLIPVQWKASDAVFIVQVQEGSAADSVHFQPGDIVLKINDRAIQSGAELKDATMAYKGQEVTVVYRRNGAEEQKKVKLGDGEAPLGVATSSFSLAAVSNPPVWKAPFVALAQIWEVAKANLHFVGSLLLGLVGIGAAPDTSQISGPVGIYGLIGQFSALGWVYVLAAIAQLSLAVALFNILPIPALDGGRLLFIAAQKVMRRKVIPTHIEGMIHTLGFILLLGLFVLVTWNDIVKLMQ